ncbi:hypothetical protein ILYODFUR_033327 [Ilyodon furcidens]|uniref:Prolactin receptor n=1 Tax=Ilyodon furcidens TaxID=33524 RepID=A0ABV0UL44_9TELE
MTEHPTLSSHLGLSVPPSAKDGHVNEAFEKIRPEPDELTRPDGTINTTVDLKKQVPPEGNMSFVGISLSTQTSEDGSFEKEFLDAHNAYRKCTKLHPWSIAVSCVLKPRDELNTSWR